MDKFDYEEDDFRSSSDMFEKFINSSIWSDLKSILEGRLEVFNKILDTGDNFNAILKAQAGKEEVASLLAMPEFIQEDLKLSEEAKVQERIENESE